MSRGTEKKIRHIEITIKHRRFYVNMQFKIKNLIWVLKHMFLHFLGIKGPEQRMISCSLIMRFLSEENLKLSMWEFKKSSNFFKMLYFIMTTNCNKNIVIPNNPISFLLLIRLSTFLYNILFVTKHFKVCCIYNLHA